MNNRVLSFNDWLITEGYTYDDSQKIETLLRHFGVEITDTNLRYYNVIVRGISKKSTFHEFHSLLKKSKLIYETYPSGIEEYSQEGTLSFRFSFGLRHDMDDMFNKIYKLIDEGPGFEMFKLEGSDDNSGNLPIVLIRGLYNKMKASLSPGEEDGILATDQLA